MYTLLNSRGIYAQGRYCKSEEIIYLDTPSEVLELIHGEFDDIEVYEY